MILQAEFSIAGIMAIKVLFVLMAANNAGSIVLMYFIPLFFQFTLAVGALNSGMRLLALVIAVTVAIMVRGALMSNLGYYQPLVPRGSILVLIGSLLLSKPMPFLPSSCEIAVSHLRHSTT